MALIGSLTSGVSAIRAQSKAIEVIGDNIANANTTAFKGSRTRFEDSISQTLQQPSPGTPGESNIESVQIGSGVGIATIRANFNQGALATTGRAADLGIAGNGFFTVFHPTGNEYFLTRDGNFRIDDQNYLVTADGMRVQGNVPPANPAGAPVDIQIGNNPPPGEQLQSYSINAAGEITEFYSDGSSTTTAQINLVNVPSPDSLKREGRNLYSALEAAGQTVPPTLTNPGTGGVGEIQQGTLEQSNVDLAEEFSDLIVAQRSFQAGSRIITVSDSVLEEVVNLKR